MTTLRFGGWDLTPCLGVVVPDQGSPGWIDAVFWCAILEAWGFPFERIEPRALARARCTTLVLPGPAVDEELARATRDALARVAGVRAIVTGDRTPAADDLEAVRFEPSATRLSPADTEDVVDAIEPTLREGALAGLVGVWRWPNAKTAALVVDGDVDHPTGVDPECSRYVAPAIETARRAGFTTYGVFAAAANVQAEPRSFPPGAEYYNHSFTHPYSHWNSRPWESLDADAMAEELTRAAETYRTELGVSDQGVFRLPHFQLEAWDRTADVLEALGYRADSSIGGNVSVTGGLPFHPARAPWSDRPEDAAYARTHPDVAGRRPFLQLPISTDPTDPWFPHGCCSYNTLGEGVRARTAEPAAYEAVLHEVLDRAVARRGLAHVFIDPPDVGYGRLPGDRPDYASAVERFLTRAVEREDLAIMTTAGLVDWWLGREAAVSRLTWREEAGTLEVTLDRAPTGSTLVLLEPGGDWSLRATDRERVA